MKPIVKIIKNTNITSKLKKFKLLKEITQGNKKIISKSKTMKIMETK